VVCHIGEVGQLSTKPVYILPKVGEVTEKVGERNFEETTFTVYRRHQSNNKNNIHSYHFSITATLILTPPPSTLMPFNSNCLTLSQPLQGIIFRFTFCFQFLMWGGVNFAK